MNFHRFITIGCYFPGESFIHRADPRLKFLLGAAYAIAVFAANGWRAAALLGFMALATTLSARVPLRRVLANLRGIWFIFLVIIASAMLSRDGTIWWQYQDSLIVITREGFFLGLFRCVQIALAVVGFALLTCTTTVFQLSMALEYLCAPLRRLGLPVSDFAMMFSLAVRFFPVLTEETEIVIRAQLARGAPLDSANPCKKIPALGAVLVPIMARTFHHAQQMAIAMECRLFGTGPTRTSLYPLDWQRGDTVFLLAGAIALTVPFL